MITDWTAYHRAYYPKRRQKVLDYLGGKCAVCGTTEQLEIDHIDPAKKSFEVSSRMSLTAVARAELDKCQLLCRPHHIEKTARENSGFRHGSIYAWMKKKCRCPECGDARRDWYDKRNAARRTNTGRGHYGRATDHGDPLHYRRGCRCDECRAANTAAMRRLRESKRN